MSEKIGCMNCGNISCKNNKKRESKGCGRWKTPEQRILELEEKVGMAERTRDRLISIGFPTFASCKEYAAKLAELEAEIVRLRNEGLDNINKYTRFAETDRKTITKLQQACHKWFMRWREAKKDAMNLQKENAELKEKIRLMNEQEARDITSRFPC